MFDKDFSKMRNKTEGDIGEVVVVNFLKNKGYKILKTNFRTKFGEIDIIAKDKDMIVFVEVKERSTLQFGRPIEAVDFRKQQKIRKVAEFYLMINHISEHDCRFDVIEMLGETINHEINAF